MKKISWNEEKNDLLRKTRNVYFELIEEAIINGNVLDVVQIKKTVNNSIMYYEKTNT
ncbi:hypothetical protein HGA88_02305 [Candidatus Roizmanbacteria bacterium]|nr:hypothetical protein [Candidatus Roizmanbacteria bacterium]